MTENAPAEPSGPTDAERFLQLLDANHPCISIATFEEDDALQAVREAAVERPLPLWQWSTNTGIHDGLVADSSSIADTEHPAAALYYALHHIRSAVLILLDLAAHLKDGKTLRLLRELIHTYQRYGGHIILIDREEDLPAVIRSSATPFELSLPDPQEIHRILKSTLRQRNEQRRLQVDLGRKDLDTIIQTLQGLTRRQIRQIILDACDDQRFDARDLEMILARKRKAVRGDGLLEFIESPVSFDEIFFVDLPAPDARRQIFAIHLKKRGRRPEHFDLDLLTRHSDGFSGAEIEQAILSALHTAYAAGQDLNTPLLVDTIASSPPLSVTMAERVATLRAWAQGRCVLAD